MIQLVASNKLTNNTVTLVDKSTDISTDAAFGSVAIAQENIQQEGSGTMQSFTANGLSVLAWFNTKANSLASNNREDKRKLGASVLSILNQNKIEEASVIVHGWTKQGVKDFVEGLVLANYQFNKYKKEAKTNSLKSLHIDAKNITQADLTELMGLAEGVFLARDLVNEPVITLNAQEFSNRMEKAGKKAGYHTETFNKAKIVEHKMGGLLGVNMGSDDEPTFNILEYKPSNAVNEQPIVLVGKGVVYDTGGNNLKTGPYMAGMKCDMGGGAAVVGAIYAIANNNLPVWTISLIPATDNRIGHNALVADDIITISDGTTVEVKNTDAEGRLILADALVYAQKYNPLVVIDMATLTGAAEAITGPYGIAMVQDSDNKFVDGIKEAGAETYERIAELPFWREYDDLLKSNVADMSNLGGPKGGAITAGKFLHHFTKYNWIHLDIAGPAFLDAQEGYKTVGGTGVGVRIAYEFAKQLV